MTDATLRAALTERAARAGGVVAREQFRGPLDVEQKSNKNDLVSEADRDAQEQVVATICQEYPDATFVCEEPIRGEEIDSRTQVPETGHTWVVDPIDGTGNYVREMPFWTTSVAAVSAREPVGVATYFPAQEDLYAAGPESVTRNGTPVSVSSRTDPETFAVGLLGWWPVRGGATYRGLFGAATDSFGDVRRFGSMQGTLALVAAGGLDAAFMPETPHPWDSLAGVHLIRRAGGTATDIDGNRWTIDADGLVVSNGQIHDAVLDAVQEGVNLETAD